MGPLSGIRIVEFAGIGPGPMAAMLLADMGATVLRVERPAASGLGLNRPRQFNFLNRGRRSVVADLKSAEGAALALSLVEKSDGLIEGFRPGAMERLGLGPEVCLARNEQLVYGRITGWGGEGPLAHAAGHDLNYVAISGALHSIGREGQPPTPPLNLLGDYGGAVYLVMGVLAAIIEARTSGQGQVVDAAMSDAATSLMSSAYGMHAAGMHNGPRGTNLLDSGLPYYDVYECADGQWVSIAPIEPKFRQEFFQLVGMAPDWLARSSDRENWPALRQELTALFKTKTRDDWCALLEGSDACFAPVLSMAEAPDHPLQAARDGFIEIDGVKQPAPAPRFSRTKSDLPTPAEAPGESGDAAMREWGYSDSEVQDWKDRGGLLSGQKG